MSLQQLMDQVERAQSRLRAKQRIKELLRPLSNQDQYGILVELATERGNKAMTPDQIKDAIKDASDWRNATITLISLRTQNDEPFSSGEIARDLRVARPDFAFSVLSVGEFIRDMFYSMGFGYDAGPAYQVPRVASGKFRTPGGQDVFVYCPDPDTGMEYDFEVDIPRPPGQNALSDGDEDDNAALPGNTASTAALPQAAQKQDTNPIEIKGQVNADGTTTFKATVHGDGRMQIPRAAFEAFVHRTGNPLRGGDPVFIRVTDKRITVALEEENDNFQKHDISKDRGRVRFMSPTDTPFSPGASYSISVSNKRITIDLD